MIVLNYLLRALLWFVSKLPFFLIYLISDLFYLIVFYIIGYRKKIVKNNLRRSFPDKTDKELKKITKEYYHNLCDIVLETLKKKGMKEEDYKKRIDIKNFEILNNLYQNNKSVIGAVGHCGNFEWMVSYVSLVAPHSTYVTYKPLHNKFFNDYMFKLRSAFGLTPFHHKKTYGVLNADKNNRTLTIIGADQAPTRNRTYYWTNFLNQETAFHIGIGKIAKLYNLAVVFIDVHKIRRGHYQIEAKLITDTPAKTDGYEIIETYKEMLEESIKSHPADWLWSHRRWKYKKEDLINN